MGVKAGCAALSGIESWVKRGLLTTLCVLLLVSLVYSAPVPDNEDPLTGNNDLASGEATEVKTNLDDGFDDLVGVQNVGVDDAKAKETEVIYRTQTQGITMPHFKFTTGPTTLPPIPKITTFHPIPMQTTPRPNEEKLHIDIQGVMTRPAGNGVFTTAHVPAEPVVEIETTQTTVSTTTTVTEATTAEAASAILVDVDTKEEKETEPTTSSTTTTTTTTSTPTEETTVAAEDGIFVEGEKVEDLEPIEELLKIDNNTTTTSPPTTTTTEEPTEEAIVPIFVGGEKAEKPEPVETDTTSTTTTVSPPTTTTAEEPTEEAIVPVFVGGEKAEKPEPVDEALETDTSTTTTTTTTVSPPTTAEEKSEEAGGAILVGAEKAEEESTTTTTTTTKPTTQTTTPVMLVIVDGGDDDEPSSTTTTTTTTTTTEPTTEAEKPIYPGIIDVKEKTTNDDVKYTTPTTTVLAYTTKLPTEQPSTTASPTEAEAIAKVGLGETKGKGNGTEDDELQKIVVSIEEEPTVIVDPEDGDVNGTMIGESTHDGLSNGARTGIAIACIVGFWIILGPLVCLICKMRDKKRDKKEQEERNAREKASNHLVEEMVKAELQKQPNGDHKKNGDYKKAQYKDETPFDEAEFEPITIGRSDSVPYIDADADSRDTEL